MASNVGLALKKWNEREKLDLTERGNLQLFFFIATLVAMTIGFVFAGKEYLRVFALLELLAAMCFYNLIKLWWDR